MKLSTYKYHNILEEKWQLEQKLSTAGDIERFKEIFEKEYKRLIPPYINTNESMRVMLIIIFEEIKRKHGNSAYGAYPYYLQRANQLFFKLLRDNDLGVVEIT